MNAFAIEGGKNHPTPLTIPGTFSRTSEFRYTKSWATSFESIFNSDSNTDRGAFMVMHVVSTQTLFAFGRKNFRFKPPIHRGPRSEAAKELQGRIIPSCFI